MKSAVRYGAIKVCLSVFLLLLASSTVLAWTPTASVFHALPAPVDDDAADELNIKYEVSRLDVAIPFGRGVFDGLQVTHGLSARMLRLKQTWNDPDHYTYRQSYADEALFVGAGYRFDATFGLTSSTFGTISLLPGLYGYTDSRGDREDWGNLFFFEGSATINAVTNAGDLSLAMAWDSAFGEQRLYPLLGYGHQAGYFDIDILLPRTTSALGRVWSTGERSVWVGLMGQLTGDTYGILHEPTSSDLNLRFHYSCVSFGPRVRMVSPDLVATLDLGMTGGHRALEWVADETARLIFPSGLVISYDLNEWIELEPAFFLRLTLSKPQQ